MSIALSTAETILAAATTAYQTALDAQAAGVGDQSVTRQRIVDLRNEVQYWSRMVDELTAAASGSTRAGVKLASWS